MPRGQVEAEGAGILRAGPNVRAQLAGDSSQGDSRVGECPHLVPHPLLLQLGLRPGQTQEEVDTCVPSSAIHTGGPQGA